MRTLSIITLLLCAGTGFAQKAANPQPFAKTITANDLKKHLYIVAGPEMEGRKTATEGQRKAAAYIENQFKQLGLLPGNKDSYQLMYNVYEDSLTGAAFEVNGQAFQRSKDFSAMPSNISATMRFSEVVVAGPNAVDSLTNADLAGKMVLILNNAAAGNRNPLRSPLIRLLRSKGVAAIVFENNNFVNSPYFRNAVTQTINPFKEAIGPQVFFVSDGVVRAITGSDYDQLKSAPAISKNYNANVLAEVKKQLNSTLQSSDVVGILPGTDLKDEYVVISAHYDHLGKRDTTIYYGADDDGSGTVGILEIAEAFAKAKAAGKGPRRSLVFLANSGEEEGLWGSEYFTNHPTIPLDKTTVDLNIDMIGRTDSSRKHGDSTNYVYVVGDDKLSSDLRTISEAQNKKYLNLELDYKFNDPNDPEQIYYRSDHYNFARKGVPIIFYYDGMLGADYHKPTDTPDKINYPLLAKRAQLVFYTAWDMANRNDMLKRDIPLNQ